MTLVKNKKAVKENKTLDSVFDSRNSKSLDELANAQGVNTFIDMTKLFGTWPGKPNDGFEEMIHHFRQRDLSLRNANE